MRRQAILLSAILSVPLAFTGCDGKPVAERPPQPPGFKDGETPPPTPDRGGRTEPLPPATAPVTPGDTPADRNHPAAPPLPPPASPSPSTADTPPLTPPEPSPAEIPAPRPDAAARPSAPAGGSRDDAITAAAYRTLASQAGISADGRLISITTVAGTVMLRGTVADGDERNRVVTAVGHVDGVRAIEDLLAVQEP